MPKDDIGYLESETQSLQQQPQNDSPIEGPLASTEQSPVKLNGPEPEKDETAEETDDFARSSPEEEEEDLPPAPQEEQEVICPQEWEREEAEEHSDNQYFPEKHYPEEAIEEEHLPEHQLLPAQEEGEDGPIFETYPHQEAERETFIEHLPEVPSQEELPEIQKKPEEEFLEDLPPPEETIPIEAFRPPTPPPNLFHAHEMEEQNDFLLESPVGHVESAMSHPLDSAEMDLVREMSQFAPEKHEAVTLDHAAGGGEATFDCYGGHEEAVPLNEHVEEKSHTATTHGVSVSEAASIQHQPPLVEEQVPVPIISQEDKKSFLEIKEDLEKKKYVLICCINESASGQSSTTAPTRFFRPSILRPPPPGAQTKTRQRGEESSRWLQPESSRSWWSMSPSVRTLAPCWLLLAYGRRPESRA